MRYKYKHRFLYLEQGESELAVVRAILNAAFQVARRVPTPGLLPAQAQIKYLTAGMADQFINRNPTSKDRKVVYTETLYGRPSELLVTRWDGPPRLKVFYPNTTVLVEILEIAARDLGVPLSQVD